MRWSSSLRMVAGARPKFKRFRVSTPCAAETVFGKAARFVVVTCKYWPTLQPVGTRGLAATPGGRGAVSGYTAYV